MPPHTVDPRTDAYLAVLQYLKTGSYIDSNLSPSSAPLARQIAYGTIQRLISLDYLARQLTKRGSLTLKPTEKAILYTALYQLFFLSGSPSYAITNEMVNLAKRECHPTFARFLNAVLRNYCHQPPRLPTGHDPQSLSLYYSYPVFLIEQLLRDYGPEQTLVILEMGNRAAPTMVRLRQSSMIASNALLTEPFPVIPIDDPLTVTLSTDAYIQNVTPVYLMGHLQRSAQNPKRILDLCAAPGGKLLLAHDLYPQALLFAHDLSKKRLKRLKENLQRYQLIAQVSCGPTDSYQTEEPFDLIVLDVPCSNSGVLGKRPEARWRISESFLHEIELTQLRLIKKATELLAPNGVIWYLTCSILKKENEQLVQRACALYSLEKQLESTVLPSPVGWDGGYACALLGH